MVATDETPLYNLKFVVQETGVQPDRLRAWERRYGLPKPFRSSGGHRLYSSRDIAILKWLIARNAEGMSIKRAVALWQRLEAEGHDPLQLDSRIPSRGAVHPTTTIDLSTSPTQSPADLRQAWLSAALIFDEETAEQILTQAFALYPTEIVCTVLLQGAVREAGIGWSRGEYTVQQEHFVTELATRRIEALLLAVPPPTRSARVLVACAPEEEHAFGTLLLTFLLRRRGLDVIYLGANVPIYQLEKTVQTVHPDLVVLAAQRLPTVVTLAAAAYQLHTKGIRVGYGGGVFNRLPSAKRHIAGHFLGEDLDQAVETIESLLASPSLALPVPESPQPSEAYSETLKLYRAYRTLIEADVWHALQHVKGLPERLPEWNAALARHIEAALELEDITLLEIRAVWQEIQLDQPSPTSEMIHQYLNAYHQAITDRLGTHSSPLAEHLAHFTTLT